MVNAASRTGRPQKASEEQLQGMALALSQVPKNSQEYRSLRSAFAVAIGCTERAIELMIERFNNKKAGAGETDSGQLSTPEGAATSTEQCTPALGGEDRKRRGA